MVAELEISASLAAKMAADVHAAMSKYAGNKDITLGTAIMAMVWLTSDMLAHVLLNNPEELREPLVSTAQGLIQMCTDVSLEKGERCGIQECLEKIDRKLKEEEQKESEKRKERTKNNATMGNYTEKAEEIAKEIDSLPPYQQVSNSLQIV